MHNILAVHMIECVTQLSEIAPNDRFTQKLLVSLAMAEQLSEIAGIGQLEHNLQLAVLHERVNVTNHIWMMQLLFDNKMLLLNFFETI